MAATLNRTAQNMVELAYEAEDGHFEQTLFDGRLAVATDYGETLMVKDFRKTTAVWTENSVTFEEMRSIINADDDAHIDSGAFA